MRLLDSIHSHFNANLKGRAYATMLISIIVITILDLAQKKLRDKMHYAREFLYTTPFIPSYD